MQSRLDSTTGRQSARTVRASPSAPATPVANAAPTGSSRVPFSANAPRRAPTSCADSRLGHRPSGTWPAQVSRGRTGADQPGGWRRDWKRRAHHSFDAPASPPRSPWHRGGIFGAIPHPLQTYLVPLGGPVWRPYLWPACRTRGDTGFHYSANWLARPRSARTRIARTCSPARSAGSAPGKEPRAASGSRRTGLRTGEPHDAGREVTGYLAGATPRFVDVRREVRRRYIGALVCQKPRHERRKPANDRHEAKTDQQVPHGTILRPMTSTTMTQAWARVTRRMTPSWLNSGPENPATVREIRGSGA